MLDAIIKLFTKDICEQLERDLDKVATEVNNIDVINVVKFALK